MKPTVICLALLLPLGARAADISPAVEAEIVLKEKAIKETRREGIGLLESFLRDTGDSSETAEALYKLAELTWEEAQSDYLARMETHEKQVTACKQDRTRCRDMDKPPRLDLSRSQATYQRLIRDYPRFRKLDTVLYLYAFSLRDQGKLGEAVGIFERLLQEYPKSRFRADAWMAVAEHRFYEQKDFVGAQRAYERVLKYPDSPLAGLALFQTAFCAWKRGATEEAAQRWKGVLDLAAKKQGSADQQKRAAELSDQALDYLVELFTEDDSKTAEDAHAFLAQIGGKVYSRKVMRRFADTVYDQARYERAADAYLFVISLDPKGADAPVLQRRVVESFQALGKGDRAVVEMRKLAVDYGPKSAWAAANSDRKQLIAETRTAAEGFIRTQAKLQHAAAQRNEKESKHVDKPLYGQAADTYAFYLEQFPDAADAPSLRYLRADILYFKLGDLRGAGNEYLAVGRLKPVGPSHKDALLNAMNAFEKLRPAAPADKTADKKRPVTDDDRRFAEAADLYSTLFPNDKEIVTVIYKNGQFFADHGDYDEAVKRFGLILEQHPNSNVASAAGDRLLECLAEAKDYANIEQWSRRLKKTRAFAGKRDQDRLDGLITGALAKQGEQLSAKDDHAGAAAAFARLAREFPNQARAPEAWNNAGASAEKAGQLGEAVAAYKTLADRYAKSPLAPGGLWVAGRIEESIGAYARAAALYEQLARKYPQAQDAPAALRQAGLLRQTLGQYDKAAALYGDYERQYRGRPETQKVAFQKGLVLQERKDWKGAAAAFAEYARTYERDPTVVEALVRKAEAHQRLGDEGATKDALAKALAFARKHKGASEDLNAYAAEARFRQGELIYREFEKVKLAGRPRQLKRALEEKAKLLDDARKVYLDVVSFRDPERATLALLRIGQAYEGYGKAMRKADVPRELSAEEKRIYREELEKAVIVIEDKALEAYRSGYAKAIEIGVYNRHTRALRQALAELDRGTFPKEVESRAPLRTAELRGELLPIVEINR